MASAVALIQNCDSQILFVQRSATSSRPLQWCLPGGKIKFGEDAASAVTREVVEETGLEIQPIRQLADFGDQCYWLCELITEGVVYLSKRECRSFGCDPRHAP